MTFKAILYDVEEHILTITLNRPEQLNAFNGDILNDLFTAFDMADADDVNDIRPDSSDDEEDIV